MNIGIIYSGGPCWQTLLAEITVQQRCISITLFVYIILCFAHMVSNGSYYKLIIFLLVDISQAHYYLL